MYLVKCYQNAVLGVLGSPLAVQKGKPYPRLARKTFKIFFEILPWYFMMMERVLISHSQFKPTINKHVEWITQYLSNMVVSTVTIQGLWQSENYTCSGQNYTTWLYYMQPWIKFYLILACTMIFLLMKLIFVIVDAL